MAIRTVTTTSRQILPSIKARLPQRRASCQPPGPMRLLVFLALPGTRYAWKVGISSLFCCCCRTIIVSRIDRESRPIHTLCTGGGQHVRFDQLPCCHQRHVHCSSHFASIRVFCRRLWCGHAKPRSLIPSFTMTVTFGLVDKSPTRELFSRQGHVNAEIK